MEWVRTHRLGLSDSLFGLIPVHILNCYSCDFSLNLDHVFDPGLLEALILCAL